MKFSKLNFATTAAAGVLLGTSPLAFGAGEGFALFSDADLYAQFRPRYEYADMDGGTEAAKAFTMRTVLGGKFNKVAGVSGLNANIEATNVSHFGFLDEYRPEQAGNDIVDDASQTTITQANVSYTASDTTLIAGRKMLTLDNHRHIGHVGWRQMPQTFDAVAVINNSVKNLKLSGVYVSRVNRIFSGVRNPAQIDTNSVL